MHRMRGERAKNEKLKKVLSGLNLGGNVQMFGPGGGGGGLDALFGGGGGGFGGNMGGGLGGMAQTDEQMRQMARAIGGLSSTTAASGGAAAEAPSCNLGIAGEWRRCEWRASACAATLMPSLTLQRLRARIPAP
eukprot:7382682-Prymnesium_polylepis.1